MRFVANYQIKGFGMLRSESKTADSIEDATRQFTPASSGGDFFAIKTPYGNAYVIRKANIERITVSQIANY